VSGTFLGRAYFDYVFTIVACTAILSTLWRKEVGAAQIHLAEIEAHA
jgi:hypothetical protein